MPFTKIKSGKNKGKYRSPSGRVYTRRQVRYYYARGGTWDGVITDAAERSFDPTGTATIRRAFRAHLQRSWRMVRNAVHQHLLNADAFGLATLGGMPTLIGDAAKLQAFQGWFDGILNRLLLDNGVIDEHVLRGYIAGHTRGTLLTSAQLALNVQRAQVVAAAAKIELQGIMEVVSQRAVRSVAQQLIDRTSRMVAVRGITSAIQNIGVVRSNGLANYAVVKAHAAGTLDALQTAGVRQVGIQAEFERHHLTTDAPYQLRTNIRRTLRSGRRRRSIERAEGRLEAAFEQVNVETAGDSRVCPVCEEIAEGGPYDIDHARTLIPAHINCRCAFTMVDQ